MSGSGISWAICKFAPRSRQITMPAPHHSVFYRPDALPAAQPTASKHWRHSPTATKHWNTKWPNFYRMEKRGSVWTRSWRWPVLAGSDRTWGACTGGAKWTAATIYAASRERPTSWRRTWRPAQIAARATGWLSTRSTCGRVCGGHVARCHCRRPTASCQRLRDSIAETPVPARSQPAMASHHRLLLLHYTCLTTSFPGQSGYASSTRKVKSVWVWI